MSRLLAEMAKLLRSNVEATARGAYEYRAFFFGPPPAMLRELHQHLVSSGGLEGGAPGSAMPVLLQVDQLEGGQSNPPIGESGICDPTFALSMRNTSGWPRFLVLVPAGKQHDLSVATAVTPLGLSAAARSGNGHIDDWWDDPFVQALVSEALGRFAWPTDQEREGARDLLKSAVEAANVIGQHHPSFDRPWALLQRVFGIRNEVSFRNEWSAACGVPPREDGSISAKEQLDVIRSIADEFAVTGFIARFDELIELAEQDEVKAALRGARNQLQSVCELPAAFSYAAQGYYSPPDPLPTWWTVLSAEVWTELLKDDRPQIGSILLECTNSLVAVARGVNGVVRDVAHFKASLPSELVAKVAIRVLRESGPVASRPEWSSDGADDLHVEDHPPIHKTPVRYVAEAAGCRKATAKVISLASFEPGVFVYCRTAKKVDVPHRPKKATTAATVEVSLTLDGIGRHFVDFYTRSGVAVNPVLRAINEPGAESQPPDAVVACVAPDHWAAEVEATEECQFELSFEDAGASRVLRLNLFAEESTVEGAASEFERLILLNRVGGKGKAPKDVRPNRQVRCSDLQSWILEPNNVGSSYFPLVMSWDYSRAWHAPNWSSMPGTVLSRGAFLHDPRPSMQEMRAPAEFIAARVALAAFVRGTEDTSLIEEARLGALGMGDGATPFTELIHAYVTSYSLWLETEPDLAPWCDTVMITGMESDGKTLSQEPYALLMSPLHPIRFTWQYVAQRALHGACVRNMYCPAAGVLDPDAVVDTLSLPLRSPNGSTKRQAFFSVDSGSDYWGVLWNASKLDRLNDLAQKSPFDAEFGIDIGGVASGFSVAQVKRALDDISTMLSAKPALDVLVTSAAGRNNACTDGIVNWAREKLGSGDEARQFAALGPRFLNVWDDRPEAGRPDDTVVANLAEDTANRVQWFVPRAGSVQPDLGIIAQLDTSNAGSDTLELFSPLGRGGLIRQRIRRQLSAGSGAFLSESRLAGPVVPSGDGMADVLASAISRLENIGTERIGYTFAPNVHVVDNVLATYGADFVAISSSAVDPACFLGGWLKNSYLWDYDLPSYSQRAGDANGYYLISRVKDSDKDAMREALSRLPGCSNIAGAHLESLMLEIARRGIPTLRGLSKGNSGAAGDVGLFVAARLLQDAFRLEGAAESVLPVFNTTSAAEEAYMVVPVDPFRAHIDDLQRALGAGELLRPDLLVVAIHASASTTTIRLSPIEVKFRGGSIMTATECELALKQARAFSVFWTRLTAASADDDLPLWQVARQHLLSSILNYGFRVYSQQATVVGRETEWSHLHQRVLAAVLGGAAVVSADAKGRLLVLDGSSTSERRDLDGDGFDETITVNGADASSIVNESSSVFLQSLRAAVGRWGLAAAAAEESDGHEPTTDVLPHDKAQGEDDLGTETPTPVVLPLSDESEGIILRLGRTVDAIVAHDRTLTLSDTSLNQLNIGVVGDLGTGKTQLLKSLLYQIAKSKDANRGIKPRVLIFDYKNDYSGEEFVAATGAKVVVPHMLPLNLFDTSESSSSVTPWLDRFKFFSDVLTKIYAGVGPVQRLHLKEAVKAAYSAAESGRAPTIYDVYNAYQLETKGKADSLTSIIGDIVDTELFHPEASVARGFGEFFDGVVVLSLNKLGQDDRSKNMLVAIMLNMFYEHMLRIPKRPFIGTAPQMRVVDSFLLVDEADNIMKYEFDVLRKLLLQGREFGVGVILASQYLSHFKVGGSDYREPLLTWFIHKVPNVTGAELSALGMVEELSRKVDRIKSLQQHHCLYKTSAIAGEILQGLPFYKIMAPDRS